MYVTTMPITSANRSFRIISKNQFEKEFPPLTASATNTTKHCENSMEWANIVLLENKTTQIPSTNIKGLKDLPMKYNSNDANIIDNNIHIIDNNIDNNIHTINNSMNIDYNYDYIDYIDYDT